MAFPLPPATFMSSYRKNTTQSPHNKNTTKNQRECEAEPGPHLTCTKAKNITQCPGVEAERSLLVRRDPVVTQEENDANKRKEERERARQEEAASGEAATCFIEKVHAQQKVAMAEKASVPHRRSQGM